jgi:hypothetical protein
MQIEQADALAKAEAAGLNVEPQLVEVRDERWMHARGLYVDYIETEAKEKIVEARQDCDEDLTESEFDRVGGLDAEFESDGLADHRRQ